MLADCAFAGVGDPAALNAPASVEPSRRGAIQRVTESGIGLVCGHTERDELAVEIGLSGSRAVAVRVELVANLAKLQGSGQGEWQDLGQVVCDRVAAIDLHRAQSPSGRVEVPLPAGQYRASAFRDTEGNLVGVVLRESRRAY